MPQTGNVLLDTNVLIALLAGDVAVLDNLGKVSSAYVPSVALGELYYGAQKSAHAEQNVRRVEKFGAAAAVLGCDAETAAYYGEIKAVLRRRGVPIPENDIWIATIGRQFKVQVVTKDAHFDAVDNLDVTPWE